jgi:hypothetical protein
VSVTEDVSSDDPLGLEPETSLAEALSNEASPKGLTIPPVACASSDNETISESLQKFPGRNSSPLAERRAVRGKGRNGRLGFGELSMQCIHWRLERFISDRVKESLDFRLQHP